MAVAVAVTVAAPLLVLVVVNNKAGRRRVSSSIVCSSTRSAYKMVNLEICLPPVLDETFFGGKVGISVLTTFGTGSSTTRAG